MPEDLFVRDLAERAKKGDKAAFGTLYQIFYKPVLSFNRYLAGPNAAEDLTQDVFQRALRYIKTLKEPEKFGSWVMRIARNRSTEWKSSCSIDFGCRDLDNSTEPAAFDDFAHSDDRVVVDSVLRRLPDELRVILYLHYLGGLSALEIALSTNIAITTVKWRIHRGLALCKQLVKRGE